MKVGNKFKVDHDYMPLYKKGDLFKIIKINEDPDLMRVEAVNLRNNQVLGFSEEEVTIEDEIN